VEFSSCSRIQLIFLQSLYQQENNLKMKFSSSLLLLASVGVANAFVAMNPASRADSAPRLWMSEPSDTSSDDFVTVDSEPYEPSAEDVLVSNVMDMLPSTVGDVSPETRSAINEAIYKLEAVNPTKEPTLSSLLNGVWELRYVGGYEQGKLPSPTRQIALFLYSGGYSPGVFALGLAQKLPSQLIEVGDLEIAISRDQPRVEAKVAIKSGIGAGESAVSVKARLEVESDLRLRETYESATIMNQSINLPTLLQYSRDIYVTYLDDDLLIVRDASGVPEILIRKQKRFSQNWGTEPSALDDLTPPGEGVEFGSPTM
jgi:PAP_fibrillin